MQTLVKQVANYFEIPASYSYLVGWGLRAVAALLVLIIVAFLARRKRIQRTIAWIDDKIGAIELTQADRNFFASVIWTAFWLGGLLVILRILKLTALLATVGATAGVLTTITALANRELLGNVFGGFVLQARGQIAPGDSIEVIKISGTLRAIGLTSCEIESFDGVVHYVPNAKMLNEPLINYSHAQFRRVQIQFWYDPDEAYAEDLEAVLDTLIEGMEGKAEGKESFYRYGDYNEKGQQINIFLFFDKENWTLNSSNVRRRLVELIDESDVQVGIPQVLTIHIEEEEEEKKSSKKKSK